MLWIKYTPAHRLSDWLWEIIGAAVALCSGMLGLGLFLAVCNGLPGLFAYAFNPLVLLMLVSVLLAILCGAWFLVIKVPFLIYRWVLNKRIQP